jgi:hypothetical protein
MKEVFKVVLATAHVLAKYVNFLRPSVQLQPKSGGRIPILHDKAIEENTEMQAMQELLNPKSKIENWYYRGY